jgi:hypothetical protein
MGILLAWDSVAVTLSNCLGKPYCNGRFHQRPTLSQESQVADGELGLYIDAGLVMIIHERGEGMT